MHCLIITFVWEDYWECMGISPCEVSETVKKYECIFISASYKHTYNMFEIETEVPRCYLLFYFTNYSTLQWANKYRQGISDGHGYCSPVVSLIAIDLWLTIADLLTYAMGRSMNPVNQIIQAYNMQIQKGQLLLRCSF